MILVLRPLTKDVKSRLETRAAAGQAVVANRAAVRKEIDVVVCGVGGVGDRVDKAVVRIPRALKAGSTVDGLVSDHVDVGICDERVAGVVVRATVGGVEKIRGEARHC